MKLIPGGKPGERKRRQRERERIKKQAFLKEKIHEQGPVSQQDHIEMMHNLGVQVNQDLNSFNVFNGFKGAPVDLTYLPRAMPCGPTVPNFHVSDHLMSSVQA